MNALYVNVQSTDLAASRDFYVDLLGLEVVFDSPWALYLQDPDHPQLKLAFVAHDHDSIPAGFRTPAQGVLVSVEVDDVDALWRHARLLGIEVRQELRDEPFGQRHFIAADPNGVLVNVIAPIPLADEFLAQYADAFGPGATAS